MKYNNAPTIAALLQLLSTLASILSSIIIYTFYTRQKLKVYSSAVSYVYIRMLLEPRGIYGYEYIHICYTLTELNV